DQRHAMAGAREHRAIETTDGAGADDGNRVEALWHKSSGAVRRRSRPLNPRIGVGAYSLGSPFGFACSSSYRLPKKLALKFQPRSSCLTCEASVSLVAPLLIASFTRVMNVSHFPL